MADKIISTVKRRERCGGRERELLLLLNVSICGYHLSLPTVKLLSSSAAHNLIASEDILLCRWWPSLRLKYYHQLNASFARSFFGWSLPHTLLSTTRMVSRQQNGPRERASVSQNSRWSRLGRQHTHTHTHRKRIRKPFSFLLCMPIHITSMCSDNPPLKRFVIGLLLWCAWKRSQNYIFMYEFCLHQCVQGIF